MWKRALLIVALCGVAMPVRADGPPPAETELRVWVPRMIPGWAKIIQKAGEIPGVDGVEVDTDHRTAKIHYKGAATTQQLADQVREKSGLDLAVLRLATFHVKGHLTANCPVLVRMALQRMDGVKGVRASVDEAKAWVDYVDGTKTSDMIALVKDRTGLDMELVSDAP